MIVESTLFTNAILYMGYTRIGSIYENYSNSLQGHALSGTGARRQLLGWASRAQQVLTSEPSSFAVVTVGTGCPPYKGLANQFVFDADYTDSADSRRLKIGSAKLWSLIRIQICANLRHQRNLRQKKQRGASVTQHD